MTRINDFLHNISSIVTGPIIVISSVLKFLWQKICQIANSIFANFPNFRRSNYSFSNKEITLLRNECVPKDSDRKDFFKDRDVTPITPPSPIIPPSPITKIEPDVLSPSPTYVTFDPTLEALRTFIHSFSKLVSEAFYNKYIADRVESSQDIAPSIASSVKSITNSLIEIGDKASAHLNVNSDQEKDKQQIDPVIQDKINQNAILLENTLGKHFGEIMRETITINTGRITDFFTERLSHIFTSINFPELFDGIVHDVLAMQIKGIAESEKHVSDHKNFLEKVHNAAKMTPINDLEKEIVSKAQNHLNSVENHGGEELFLEHMFLEKFKQQSCCKEEVREIIEQEIDVSIQKKDHIHLENSIENVLFEEIADKIMEIFAPLKIEVMNNGVIEEIDPLSIIWERLYIPNEFKSILSHFKELGDELFSSETSNLFVKLKKPTNEILKELFISLMREQFKKYLTIIIKLGFEEIANIKKFNEHLIENILPSVNIQLIKYFMQQEMAFHLNEFSSLFHTLITDDESKRELHRKSLQYSLIEAIKNKFMHFDPKVFYATETHNENGAEINFSKLSDDSWLFVANNITLALEKEILNAKVNEMPVDPKNISFEDVHSILSHYFHEISTKNTPGFGKIAMDLIFKLGDMPLEGLMSFFLEERISTAITSCTEEMRSSYHYLTGVITTALRESFLSKTRVNELLFANSPVPLLTKEKLAHEIHVTSNIIFDILMRQADQKNAIHRFFFQKGLSSNANEIDRQTSLIFKKLFGKRFININFVTSCCDKVFHEMSIAAQKIPA